MAYKKPQIVAKSAANQTFVAGCPTNMQQGSGCMATMIQNQKCNIGIAK